MFKVLDEVKELTIKSLLLDEKIAKLYDIALDLIYTAAKKGQTEVIFSDKEINSFKSVCIILKLLGFKVDEKNNIIKWS